MINNRMAADPFSLAIPISPLANPGVTDAAALNQQAASAPASGMGLLSMKSIAFDILAASTKAEFQAAQKMQQRAASANAVASNAGAGAETQANAAPQGGAQRRAKIAQIDDFGSNHGNAVGQAIQQGTGGNADIIKFDVQGGNTSGKIASSLNSIVQRVRNGETIDAVNISMQDFNNGPDKDQIHQSIAELKRMGVPVVVAAGNNGPGQVNRIGDANSFNVESATNGQRNASSGMGNVQAEGQTTSFAAANLTAQIANRKASGASMADIESEFLGRTTGAAQTAAPNRAGNVMAARPANLNFATDQALKEASEPNRGQGTQQSQQQLEQTAQQLFSQATNRKPSASELDSIIQALSTGTSPDQVLANLSRK